MSPNEWHGDDGRFTSPPEGGPPADNGPPPEQPDPWAQVREAGITPEQALEGGRKWRDLNNLDTRQQALQSIYRPDVDTWLTPAQQAEQEDPFAQYEPQQEQYEQPQYQEPYQEQPAFDPRQFGETVAGAAEERAYQRVMTELQGMMAAQQFQDAAEAVTKEYGLPASDAAYIDWQARQVAQQQPNRAPADIAREIAHKRQQEFQAWQATSMPPPSAQPATPGGPVPSSFQPPSSDEEAMRLSRELLDQ